MNTAADTITTTTSASQSGPVSRPAPASASAGAAASPKDAARLSRWQQRVDSADWNCLSQEVGERGCALTPPLLTPGSLSLSSG